MAVLAGLWGVGLAGEARATGPASGTAVANDRAAPSEMASGTAAARELLWPTDAGRCVTSTFCEFRSGHFHSGIDISTNGRTGFRVFAVDDGDIVRVRAGCRGYGKAVYLRLSDGRTAVYGHLDRFAGAVEDTARAIGRRTGAAYFDREFPPGTFVVRRGDIVAYSGETGIGVPHLHVELRDAGERPLDPLRAGLRVPDARKPRIRRVAITPLAAGSVVDGGGGTALLGVQGGRVERTVPVEGAVGLALDVVDAKDGCRYDLAPAAVGLRENGRTISEIRYDRFSFDETGQVDFQIDPRFSYAGRGRFHNLYRRPGWDLPFAADGDPRRGVLTGGASGEERRTFELFARDSQGNEVTAVLELSFGAAPTLTDLRARHDDAGAESDSLVVSGAVSGGGRRIARIDLDRSTDLGRTWESAGRAFPAADGSFRATLAPTGVPSMILRTRPIDRLGVEGVARSLGVGSAPAEAVVPKTEVLTQGSFWEVRLAGPFEAVLPDSGTGALVRSVSTGASILLPAAAAGAAGTERVATLVDPWGCAVPIEVSWPTIALPGEGVRILADGGRAEFSVLPQTVREPTAVLATVVAGWAHAPDELVSLGSLVRVDVGAVPLASEFVVRLSPARPPTSRGRVAVFVQDGRGFRYIGGREELEGAGWVARARTAAPIGLFEDVVPPSLGAPSLASENGRARLVFAVRDRGSGLDCDGIEVLVNGRPVPHELDEERGEVVGYPDAGGAFEIRAVDRCGNAARWRGTLRTP